jgi:hypothetical protein
MQTTATSLEEPCSPEEGAPYLSVMITYQDLECSQRAMNAFESLVANLGGEYIFTRSTWKFDLLQFPKMREMAARDALDADIIIICAHEEADMPPEVDLWIQDWAGRKVNSPSALVALFERAEDRCCLINPAKSKLEEVARRIGMAFFSETLDIRETEIDCLKDLTARL